MTFEVEESHPVPHYWQRTKYPFSEMGVGESFFASGITGVKASQCAYQYGKRSGKRFISRREGDGYRIFRAE